MIAILQRIAAQDAQSSPYDPDHLPGQQNSGHDHDHDHSNDENDEEDEDEDDDGASTTGLSSATLARLIDKLDRGLDLGPEDLTPHEQRTFLRAVTRGTIPPSLAEWEPWWMGAETITLSPTGTALLQNVSHDETWKKETTRNCVNRDRDHEQDDDNDDDDDEVEFVVEDDGSLGHPPRPWAPPGLPTLSDLTKQPSPRVGNSVASLLVTYAGVHRLHLGDWVGSGTEAVTLALTISPVLTEGTPAPVSMGAGLVETTTALATALLQFGNTPGSANALAQLALGDAVRILTRGRGATLSALAHFARVVEQAGRVGKEDQNRRRSKHHPGEERGVAGPPTTTKTSQAPKAWRQSCRTSVRKITFVAALVNEHIAVEGDLDRLARAAAREWTRRDEGPLEAGLGLGSKRGSGLGFGSEPGSSIDTDSIPTTLRSSTASTASIPRPVNEALLATDSGKRVVEEIRPGDDLD